MYAVRYGPLKRNGARTNDGSLFLLHRQSKSNCVSLGGLLGFFVTSGLGSSVAVQHQPGCFGDKVSA